MRNRRTTWGSTDLTTLRSATDMPGRIIKSNCTSWLPSMVLRISAMPPSRNWPTRPFATC